jgi:predicted DNA binding protein
VFWVNNGKESKAVPTIYRVYLTQTSQTQQRNLKANDPLNVDILKHGKKNQYMVFFDLKTAAKVRVTYINASEEVIYTKEKKVKAGTSYWKTFLPKKNGIYRIIVQTTTGELKEWEQFLFIDE